MKEQNQIIIYQTEDGQTSIDVEDEDEDYTEHVENVLESVCEKINSLREKYADCDNIIKLYQLSFDVHYLIWTTYVWIHVTGLISRLMMNYIQFEFMLMPSFVIKEHKQALFVACNRF